VVSATSALRDYAALTRLASNFGRHGKLARHELAMAGWWRVASDTLCLYSP